MHTTLSLSLGLFATTCLANDVVAGYNVYEAAQVMVAKAAHSWEWGIAAEALLELYNPELSVYSSDPFPGGKIPKANPETTLALKYARQFINTNSQVFVANSAVGDPASLGVSALLLGQSDNKYIDASIREANYLLNDAPRYSNGAISHRPDVAELWADNVAMSFPFLAYMAVQQNNVSLMAETVNQIRLHRAVLKGGNLNWQHIIGPQSQDTGLWSTGNGWAALGMTRVLYTLQKWSSSSGTLGSQAGQLKSWIKDILDGAMQSGTDNGLLHNYLGDGSWFGEISGTAVLSAIAYRMAVNDPGMFGKQYITWADNNRKVLGGKEGDNGIFSPAVNPYNWKDHNQYTAGSPEGQAFTVFLYTAFRDCLNAGVCQGPSPTTISHPGIGPIDILTVLGGARVTFSEMSAPTGTACSGVQSCDIEDCAGKFLGNTKYPTCIGGSKKGCQCKITDKTCGPRQACNKNGCAGSFNGLGNVKYAQCTGNFEGCECLASVDSCGPHASCDQNGCEGSFNNLGNVPYAVCTGNFMGCNCTAKADTCGPHAPCDNNGCAGSFNGLGNVPFAQCTGNFKGCECKASDKTCGSHLSCDLHGCSGSFNGLGNVPFAKCTGNFQGCDCLPQPDTCGPAQDCTKNGCNGQFNLNNGKAYCTGNFRGCECKSNAGTCGEPQPCDKGNCDGNFISETPLPVCTNFFKGCVCQRIDATCGPMQGCDDRGCAGGYDAEGVARCQGNFKGCKCKATANTCGKIQDCDKGGCNGSFNNGRTSVCTGNFKGCVCNPVAATCGGVNSCSADGCNGSFNGGNPICTNDNFGCPCRPDGIWIPPVHPPPQQQTYTSIVLISEEFDTPQPHEYTPIVWHVFNINGVFTDDSLCTYHDLVNSGGTLPYPESMPAFNIEHFTNCKYSGSKDSVGTMTCDGNTQVSCVSSRGASNCNNIGGSLYDDAVLFWNVECTITGPGTV